jgi:hypothetical protein
VDCGKALLQAIITALFAAEHLMLEDEQSSKNGRMRLDLGAHLKAIAVNEVHSCHAKHRDAVNLRPFWMLSISLNDQAECLLVLPPIREDIFDKIILLQCTRPQGGFPTGTPEKRAAYWRTLTAEISAFLDYLVRWQIPSALRDERFGVGHFHHPQLLEALNSLSSEEKLLELIDRELWQEPSRDTWEGTAGELESNRAKNATPASV